MSESEWGFAPCGINGCTLLVCLWLRLCVCMWILWKKEVVETENFIYININLFIATHTHNCPFLYLHLHVCWWREDEHKLYPFECFYDSFWYMHLNITYEWPLGVSWCVCVLVIISIEHTHTHKHTLRNNLRYQFFVAIVNEWEIFICSQ
jgi:hypothetical protein